MDLEIDLKNIIEMGLIRDCINKSDYKPSIKKQLIKYVDELFESLVNGFEEMSSEEDITDDEEWGT